MDDFVNNFVVEFMEELSEGNQTHGIKILLKNDYSFIVGKSTVFVAYITLSYAIMKASYEKFSTNSKEGAPVPLMQRYIWKYGMNFSVVIFTE
ncbi:hypothetical protein [Scytonema sp. UIC 10036]|uniref:hypothetical protein n=1 Tax=Scytonema sp. UIC 10036 TaxID=2304196 RepID=UPI001A9C1A6A|nr:hypothetical protein [Scytonema sp. UIC 10036]